MKLALGKIFVSILNNFKTKIKHDTANKSKSSQRGNLGLQKF